MYNFIDTGLDEDDNWVTNLEEYSVQYNTAAHRSLGDRSPFYIYFGRKPNCEMSFLFRRDIDNYQFSFLFFDNVFIYGLTEGNFHCMHA